MAKMWNGKWGEKQGKNRTFLGIESYQLNGNKTDVILSEIILFSFLTIILWFEFWLWYFWLNQNDRNIECEKIEFRLGRGWALFECDLSVTW